ncbi:MAG: diguanylate cyclase, partial [Bacillota bacterium]|nr:diguanylate cyclase [Bacillota bacterium]
PDSRAAAGQGFPGEDRRVLSLSSKKDGTWKWNPRTNHMDLSEELLDMLGYRPGDVTESFAKYTQLMHPRDFGQVLHDLEELKKQKADVMTREIRMQCADGRYKWICCQARSLVDRDGHLVEIQGIHKDISERKEREEQMQYQKMRDELTALYNRSYFEDTLRRLNTERMHPLTIFFVEVGNLKETYEAKGAEAAEAVLLKTAEMMRSIFRYEDVVARWNDRTFAIVLPNTAAEMTETIHERITKTTEVYQEELKDAPLAIGYSTKNFVENDMEAVFMGARQRLNQSREALNEIH